MNRELSEHYNIQTRIGPLLFDIHLDGTFLSAQGPSRTNRHNHSSYELHFVVEGSGRLVLNRDEIELQPDHYYVIPPGVYHAIIPIARGGLRKYTFRFDYTVHKENGIVFPANEAASLRTALMGMPYWEERDLSGNIDILHHIVRELDVQPLGYYAKLQSLFNQIIVNVIRSTASQVHAPTQMPSRMSDDRRSQVIDAFFDQYRSDLNLEDLAEQLLLSPRQTSRILCQLYGTTFRQKLADIRIEEAKDRLKHSKDSILLIAEQLGFASQTTFSTMFKKKIGQTPQSYRRK